MKPGSSRRSAPSGLLLDTNVISELRKPVPEAGVVRVLRRARADEVFLSAVTLGELTFGVERLDAGRRRAELGLWLEGLKRTYSRHILPLDAAASELWGTLAARCAAQGATVSTPDAQIAAIALHHGLALVTRNTSDFLLTGAWLIDPWEPDR